MLQDKTGLVHCQYMSSSFQITMNSNLLQGYLLAWVHLIGDAFCHKIKLEISMYTLVRSHCEHTQASMRCHETEYTIQSYWDSLVNYWQVDHLYSLVTDKAMNHQRPRSNVMTIS